MEQPRRELVELRAGMLHLSSELADVRQEFRTDIRRLDDRIFQLMLLQLGTLATALASLVAALVT
ncbi:MAG: hypothetical protein E6G33_05540 [Actinobacteria bacterium]|nr:MAG: hypothetical protein E6G33_05540 [Actinomycetota bacterium]